MTKAARERLATEAAAWVIRQDPRLLGVPKARPGMIREATATALGEAPDERAAARRAILDSVHPDNRGIVVVALHRAIAAAKIALETGRAH